MQNLVTTHMEYVEQKKKTAKNEDGVQLPSSRLKHRTKPCRYFLAGSCAQGTWCKFKHPASDQDDAEDIRDFNLLRPPVPQKRFRMLGLPSTKGCASQPVLNAPITCIPGYVPSILSPCIESPPGGVTSPMLPPAFYMPQSFHPVISPIESTNYDYQFSPISSESAPSTSTVDDLANAVEKVELRDGYQPPPSTSPPAAEPKSMPSPTPQYYARQNNSVLLNAHVVLPPQYVGYYAPQVATPTPPSRPRSQSQPPAANNAQKSAYKTKPCKFYKRGSVCQMGDRCTYIHDARLMDASPKLETIKSEEPGSPLTTAPSLPPKPISTLEESHKKGFYPISWRVIGGGVMMGGKRPVCAAFLEGTCEDGDDCKDSHEVEGTGQDSNPHSPTLVINVREDTVKLKSPPLPAERATRHKSSRSLSIVMPADNETPETVEPPNGTTARPRSMCITASTRVDFTSLFASAESP